MIRYAAIFLGAVLLTSLLVGDANARWPSRPTANRWAEAHSMTRSWHGNHYHTSYGRPVALVVPPTATSYSSYGWGVTGSEVRPIYPQFGMGAGMSGMNQPQLQGTPMYPQSTDQFGVYYVRGPW
jgi:hypothetical protein